MKFHLPKTLRLASSRLGSLVLLFQRSPLVQMLFPEAKIISGAGLGEITKWTVATVAGLGAYDSVSGASGIVQIYPEENSTTLNTAVGAYLNFIPNTNPGTFIATGFLYQNVQTIGPAGSWSIDGQIPPGLNHLNSTSSYTDGLTGIPTEEGVYGILVTAWKGTSYNDVSISQFFTINVGPAVITSHPASTSVASGATTMLSVAGTGPGLTYQWYKGTVPSVANRISGATSASYTTQPITSTTSYLAQVTKGTIVSFSNVATVTVSANNTFADWRTARFNATQLSDPNISGPTANPDGDSADNTAEYVFGTLPLTRENAPLSIAMAGSDVSLTFTARLATGAGYAGRTRHHALEKRSDLVSGTWTSPAGYSDIIGNNQTVTFTAPRGVTPEFYRLRVWLTP